MTWTGVTKRLGPPPLLPSPRAPAERQKVSGAKQARRVDDPIGSRLRHDVFRSWFWFSVLVWGFCFLHHIDTRHTHCTSKS